MVFKFVPHKDKYFLDYQRFVDKLTRIHGRKLDTHHIGSTSVPGLGGKGIIDILIGVKSWREAENIISSLKNVGIKYSWPKTDGRIFLSNKKINSQEGDFHVHIVCRRTKQYAEMIRFRNILQQNNSVLEEYKKAKLRGINLSNGNRTLYKHLKGYFIEKILCLK